MGKAWEHREGWAPHASVAGVWRLLEHPCILPSFSSHIPLGNAHLVSVEPRKLTATHSHTQEFNWGGGDTGPCPCAHCMPAAGGHRVTCNHHLHVHIGHTHAHTKPFAHNHSHTHYLHTHALQVLWRVMTGRYSHLPHRTRAAAKRLRGFSQGVCMFAECSSIPGQFSPPLLI